MTAAERLARAILRASENRQTVVDFGVATVSGGLALVSGIAAEPLPVDMSGWHSYFAAEVAAGGGKLNQKRVIMLFKNGQPTILGTTGA